MRNRQAIAGRKAQVAAWPSAAGQACRTANARDVVFMLSEPATAHRLQERALTRNRAGAQRRGERFVVDSAS
jgi:hypothetical protein